VDTEAVRRAVAVGLSTLCVLSCGRVNETAGSDQLSERFGDVTVTLNDDDSSGAHRDPGR
jgi:hypothetical protein